MPFIVLLSACAQGRVAGEKHGSDVKLGQDVVQGAVIFESGAKDGAVVPEISSPRLRAIMVEEKIEGALEHGSVLCLKKPFEISQLVSAIQSLIAV